MIEIKEMSGAGGNDCGAVAETGAGYFNSGFYYVCNKTANDFKLDDNSNCATPIDITADDSNIRTTTSMYAHPDGMEIPWPTSFGLLLLSGAETDGGTTNVFTIMLQVYKLSVGTFRTTAIFKDDPANILDYSGTCPANGSGKFCVDYNGTNILLGNDVGESMDVMVNTFFN